MHQVTRLFMTWSYPIIASSFWILCVSRKEVEEVFNWNRTQKIELKWFLFFSRRRLFARPIRRSTNKKTNSCWSMNFSWFWISNTFLKLLVFLCFVCVRFRVNRKTTFCKYFYVFMFSCVHNQLQSKWFFKEKTYANLVALGRLIKWQSFEHFIDVPWNL